MLKGENGLSLYEVVVSEMENELLYIYIFESFVILFIVFRRSCNDVYIHFLLSVSKF